MEAQGTKAEGSKAEKKTDISALGPSPDMFPLTGPFQNMPIDHKKTYKVTQ